MDGAQVRVLKEADKERLRGLVERADGEGLEAEVALEVLCDLADEPLEGNLMAEAAGSVARRWRGQARTWQPGQ